MNSANPSTAQSRIVVDELLRHGVCDVVLCPGSRSAGVAFALAAAASEERVRLHVRIDERSAGFLALGLSLASDRPVPVVVTSGTAVANLHPAIIEAHESCVQVIAVTANRPPSLWGSGANQTIEQHRAFGQHAPTAHMPLARDLAEAPRWRSLVDRAMHLSQDPAPGPVQLDLPFVEPLVPGVGDEDDTAAFLGAGEGVGAAADVAARPAPWITRLMTSDAAAPTASARPGSSRAAPAAHFAGLDFGPATRTLVIAGSDAGELGPLAGLPTFAEPGAGVPRHSVHPLAVPTLSPDRVIVVGRPTLHRPVNTLLAREGVEVFAVRGRSHLYYNPAGAAQTQLPALPAAATAAEWQAGEAWLAEAADANAKARQAVHAELQKSERGEVPPTGMDVASAVMGGLAEGDALFVGASNPIRDVSLVDALPGGVRVYSNRGASGIDGNVSTATGIALSRDRGAGGAAGAGAAAGAGGRTVALVGDLTFLHDLGALLIGPGEPRPADLTIVVANDSGGGIFSLLEQGDERFAAHFERVFGTPHHADLAALCAGYGIAYAAPEIGELPGLLAGGSNGGVRVLEVRTSRRGLRERHRRIGGW